MDDTISRQAAIEIAMEELESGTYFDIPSKIKDLPSAQPMQTNTHNALTALDCISRQAAIDALCKRCDLAAEDDEPCTEKCNDIKMLEKLPSAQPYTDAEIQKMQELEQAELQTAYELGKQDAQPEIIRCKDCEWWEKQKDSLQGRCELMQMYPTGAWYCGNAQRRETDG